MSSSMSLPVYLGRDRGREHRPLSQLLYLRAETNYSWLVWANGERVLIPRTLTYFLARLPTNDFIRIHRQWVVNRHQIVRLKRGDDNGYVACLATGEELPISRRRWRVIRIMLTS